MVQRFRSKHGNPVSQPVEGSVPHNKRMIRGILREVRVPMTSEFSLKHLKNMENEILKIMEEHNLSKFPTEPLLKSIGCSYVVTAARVHHGGITSVKAGLIEKGLIKPDQ